MIENNDIQCLMGVQVLKKKFAGPINRPIRAKKGQNEFIGHFLVQNALVFADFAHCGWE